MNVDGNERIFGTFGTKFGFADGTERLVKKRRCRIIYIKYFKPQDKLISMKG